VEVQGKRERPPACCRLLSCHPGKVVCDRATLWLSSEQLVPEQLVPLQIGPRIGVLNEEQTIPYITNRESMHILKSNGDQILK